MIKTPKKRNAILINETDKDTRAVLMMLDRVKGRTIAQIAEDYNCATLTVQTYLDRARTSQMILSRAKELIGERLIPLALAVYDDKLKEGDLLAAKDVLFGFGALSKESTIKHQSADPDTLDAFRATYFKAEALALPPSIEVVPESTSAPSVALGNPAPINESKQLTFWGGPNLPDQSDEDE